MSLRFYIISLFWYYDAVGTVQTVSRSRPERCAQKAAQEAPGAAQEAPQTAPTVPKAAQEAKLGPTVTKEPSGGGTY